MGAPSTAITRLDLSLTYQEFNIIANLRRFIGLRVLPPLGVMQEAAEFPKIVIASLLTKIEDTQRAPRSEYNKDSWEWTKDSYVVSEHGVEETIDDATVERYGDVVRSEQTAVIRGVNRVLQRLEYDVAAAVFNTGTWTGSALTTAIASGAHWNNATQTTVDPIADIDAAHDKVSASCGEDANTLVLTKKGFRALIRTSRVESLLKYDASDLLLATNDGQNMNAVPEAARRSQQFVSG